MATRKSKSIAKVVEKRTPNAGLTLTIPVLKPRNLLATHPLLKKSAAHNNAEDRNKRRRGSALEVRHGVQDSLNRRRGGDDAGGNDGGDGE